MPQPDFDHRLQILSHEEVVAVGQIMQAVGTAVLGLRDQAARRRVADFAIACLDSCEDGT